MMTQTHLIFGLAAFGRPRNTRVTAAAVIGSLLPDLSLYGLAIWHLWVLGTTPDIVFGQLYYSESWQNLFRVDNSIVLWGIALVIAGATRSKVAIALCGAALLHLCLDFPFHNDDARAHFWPITNWKFLSPISYWDDQYYGHIFGPVEVILSLLACIWLWLRFQGWRMRVAVGLLTAVQVLALVASVLRVMQ